MWLKTSSFYEYFSNFRFLLIFYKSEVSIISIKASIKTLSISFFLLISCKQNNVGLLIFTLCSFAYILLFIFVFCYWLPLKFLRFFLWFSIIFSDDSMLSLYSFSNYFMFLFFFKFIDCY